MSFVQNHVRYLRNLLAIILTGSASLIAHNFLLATSLPQNQYNRRFLRRVFAFVAKVAVESVVDGATFLPAFAAYHGTSVSHAWLF